MLDGWMMENWMEWNDDVKKKKKKWSRTGEDLFK
jgi:hypothetical protein